MYNEHKFARRPVGLIEGAPVSKCPIVRTHASRRNYDASQMAKRSLKKSGPFGRWVVLRFYDFMNLRPHLPNFHGRWFFVSRRFFASKNRRVFTDRRTQQDVTAGRPTQPYFIFVLDLDIYCSV